MPSNLNATRNVFIWDLRDNEDRIPLGGLRQIPGITHKDFRQMLDILLITSGDCVIQNEQGDEILRDDQPLSPGNYIVVADNVEVNDEVVYTRAHSIATGTRVRDFTEAVRARDDGCVISKTENTLVYLDDWTGFEAAHIFPLAYESHWREHNYGRWITLVPPQGSSINSVQNGLLLRADLHILFDCYRFSINPDNGYKIIFFAPGLNSNLSGQTLEQRLLNDRRCPPDTLFRWHFRQAVLTNMRGAGEPSHEMDFPPGSDIMGTIMTGPKAAERMEFELFDRLAHQMEILEGGMGAGKEKEGEFYPEL